MGDRRRALDKQIDLLSEPLGLGEESGIRKFL
jgi:hypothetical protein